MRRFILGTEQHDGSFLILRKSARGHYTTFGQVLRRRAGELVAYSWREFGGDEYGCFDTPEAALADYRRSYLDGKSANNAIVQGHPSLPDAIVAAVKALAKEERG
jgi:hypothetical protein